MPHILLNHLLTTMQILVVHISISISGLYVIDAVLVSSHSIFSGNHYYTGGALDISDQSIGFDQLCWHNFRIIWTKYSGISIKHNFKIIGSDLHI